MIRGEIMRGNDRSQGLGDLARDVMRALFVYALMLQTLAPLAIAQMDGRDRIEGQPVLCSAIAGSYTGQPTKTPARIVHDCLSCCLASAVGILTSPAQLPSPAVFSQQLTYLAPELLIAPARSGWPPPQRAPPDLA